MKFELNDYHRNTSDEELLQDLINVSKLLEKDSVTMDDYNQYGRFSASTMCRHFGSWFNCLEKAGLKMTRSAINIPNELLFEEIEKVWIRLGRQPKYAEMNEYGKYSVGTYERRFGGWRKALVAFVNYINEDEEETSDSEKEIIVYHETYNSPPSKNDPKPQFAHKTKRIANLRTRFLVFQRDNFKCCSCGASPAKDSSVELHVDHIVPWSKGGETVPENLQTLCSKCNLGKSNL